MNNMEFIKKLESFYEKELPVEKIKALNDFIVEEDISDVELDVLYNKVIRENETNFFPVFSFIRNKWQETRFSMRERKMDSEASSIYDKNKDEISKWWRYPAQKILNIVRIINTKPSLDFSDREFRSIFDFIFYEVGAMERNGFVDTDICKRIDYIMNSARMNKKYEPITMTPVQTELFK